MQIIHNLDDFLFTIFPNLKANQEYSQFISKLEDYYTFNSIKPEISIQDGLVIVTINTSLILSQEMDYDKAIDFCEKGNFVKAKEILKNLIEKNPTNSEYHRVLGQIFSEEGNQEEAINYLIDALRWNPKNGWALLMMGNIFSKFKKDIPTALKYYNQSLLVNPTDYIVVTNIGANLMQQGNFEEAKQYFSKAMDINKDYPNIYYALSVIAEKENDLHLAFSYSIQAVKLCKSKDLVFQNSIRQAFLTAEKIVKENKEISIVKKYLHKLEFDCDKQIDLVEDSKISTAAKLELAEVYNHVKHVLKYKPNYLAVQHLILHELFHLDFITIARNNNCNKLFISNADHKKEFIKTIQATLQLLKKKGISEDNISKYIDSIFEGLNLQIYNTPIDLFIENEIFTNFVEMRPYQFLSLYALIQEGIKSVTDTNTIELTPGEILSKSKIYNLVNAFQFKELFGIDLIDQFKSTFYEIEKSEQFYSEYLKFRENKKPAEEYELVQGWAENLLLNNFFELVNELEFREGNSDYPMSESDLTEEQEMFQFQRSQEAIGTNMAVVMYMVGALEYFEKLPLDKIKKIAFEIAMLGAKGFNTDKKDYTISSIPEKVFSGYQILAYYYVSWKIAVPEMLSQLQLPFNDEYKIAYEMYKK